MRKLLFAAALAAGLSTSPALAAGGFDVVVLGARGGIEDGNLSAYLIKPHDDPNYVSLDVGTLVNGLRVADENGAFDDVNVPADSDYSRIGFVLTDRVKGYLVSHAHLDHIAGLIIASPDDSAKPLYALASVNERIARNYFNWEAWPNFGDKGKPPALKKYAYRDLKPGSATPLDGTRMTVTAFPLSHGGVESTAFVIGADDDIFVYFGDTGPDAVEKSTHMHDVWVAIAEKAKSGHLKGIIIETSYTNAQPDDKLFGHLTPAWLLKSLHDLADQAGGGDVLAGLPVVIGHIKYSLKKGPPPQQEILEELQAGNDLKVNFIVPEQGMHRTFD